MSGKLGEENRIDINVYQELLEKVLLPLPMFLSYVLQKYPEYGKKTWYDFYLKNRARKMDKVLSLHCELTPRCNLDCKMCYVHSEKIQKKELSTEQWMDILKQAVDAGIYSVCLSGGEAMLHPGFWEMYEYLHKKGVQVSVFTNGLCLNDETVKRFQKIPPKLIQVSLYGVNDDGYSKVTGRPAFTIVDQALQRLKEAGVLFQIAVTPSRFLYPDIEDILKYLEKRGYPYKVNKALFTPRGETGRNLEEIDLTKEELGNIWKLLQQKRSEKGIKERLSIPWYSLEPSEGIRCSSGITAAYINYEGIMNGCVALPIANVDVCALGFKEAWDLVHKRSLEYRMPKECINCEKYSVCTHCPAEHFQTVAEGKCNTAICERTDYYLEYQIIPQNKCDE